MPGIYGTQSSGLFKGVLYRRPYGSTGPRFPFGNCSAVTVGAESEVKEVKNYTRPNAGLMDSLQRTSKVPFTITVLEFTPENWALGVGGLLTPVSAGTVTEEEITLHAGALTPMAHPNSAVTAIKSKDGDDAAARANSTAYLEGDFIVPAAANGHYYKVTVAGTSDTAPPTFPTDGTTVADGSATLQDMGLIAYPLDGTYVSVTRGSIYAPDAATFGGISATTGVPVLVTYTKSAYSDIQAIINAGQEWDLYFEGYNEMQGNRIIRGQFYRAKFSLASQIDLVGDDPASLELTGDALIDSTITDPNKSQHYWMQV